MRIKDQQVLGWTKALAGDAPDDNAVVRLLAALGDSTAAEEAALLTQLGAPGVTREQQLELVKSGLDADEVSDVKELLTAVGPQLSAGSRNFLEALLGTAALDSSLPLLQVSADEHNGVTGLAFKDATVEAVNLSTTPTGTARLTDAVELGRTDSWGRFKGTLGGAQTGDVLRLRARDAQGKTSDWVNVRVQGSSGDMRAAFVALNRIRLTARSDGMVELGQHTRRPLCEPGATLRFLNHSTGTFADVKVDPRGALPSGLQLAGKPGDNISVAVSDGAGNQNLATTAGTLVVPSVRTGGNLVDPAPLDKDRTARATHVDAPLFVGGASPQDVKQGAIGNCYVPASLAAVAAADKDELQEIIRDNQDGTYTVRFYPMDNGLVGDPVFVDVDADLVTDWSGAPRYASTTGWVSGVKELWVSLVEKAYAQWRGGYEVVAQGGSVGMMQANLLGRPNTELWTHQNTADVLWNALRKGVQEQRAMSAGTHGIQESARYNGTGVHANHAYSILGTSEDNGVRQVILRNPWGSGEPTANGADDGIFRLPVEEFMRLYQVLNVC